MGLFVGDYIKWSSSNTHNLSTKDYQKDKIKEIMDGDAELELYDTKTYKDVINSDVKLMQSYIDDKRVFESGSQRDNDTNKPLPSHLDAYVRLRYGYLLRQGANHYEKGNWRKGQPTETAIESLHRHLAKFEINLQNGVEQDEDHLSAIIFNVQLIMKNEEKEGITVDKYYKKK